MHSVFYALWQTEDEKNIWLFWSFWVRVVSENTLRTHRTSFNHWVLKEQSVLRLLYAISKGVFLLYNMYKIRPLFLGQASLQGNGLYTIWKALLQGIHAHIFVNLLGSRKKIWRFLSPRGPTTRVFQLAPTTRNSTQDSWKYFRLLKNISNNYLQQFSGNQSYF